jgi:hypothetical protein
MATKTKQTTNKKLSNPQWLDSKTMIPLSNLAGDPRSGMKLALSVDCPQGVTDVMFYPCHKGWITSIKNIKEVSRDDTLAGGRVRVFAEWDYRYSDADYGKPSRIFFQARINRQNKIDSKMFETNWRTLTSRVINNAEKGLKTGSDRKAFKDIINLYGNGNAFATTDNSLPKIIADNISSLDDDSILYLEDKARRQSKSVTECVRDIFNDITVYYNIDPTSPKVSKVFKTLNIPNLFANANALTLGNNIYYDGPIHSPIDQGTAEFLVHEAIHSIQARAFGMSTRNIAENVRAAHFITYCLNTEYSEYNKYEEAAYKFSGDVNSLVTPNSLQGYNQIMPQYGNWWL